MKNKCDGCEEPTKKVGKLYKKQPFKSTIMLCKKCRDYKSREGMILG